jgi:acetylcholinesterase
MASRIIVTLITLLLAVVLTSASPLFQPLPVPANAPRVDLDYARYVGTKRSNGVYAFLGMRYAAAPVGDLRWRAPVEPPLSSASWEPALKFRPVCLGNAVSALDSSEDEDCLFVNVWTPSNATVNSRLPVWVFIQGGGMFTVSIALPFMRP